MTRPSLLPRPLLLALLLLAGALPAAAARRALVIKQAGDPDAETAAQRIISELRGRGFDVVETTTRPADLAPYCCVWDTRVREPIDGGDASAYLGFLRDGHGLGLLGENLGFDARNQSVASLLRGTLGGGNVQVSSSVHVPNVTVEQANPSHPVTTQPANLGQVTYDGVAAGVFESWGNGDWLTELPSQQPSVVAAAWREGELAAARDGRAAVVLDINWLVQTFNQTDNRDFLGNLSRFLCPETSGRLEVDIASPPSFTRECPDTVDLDGDASSGDPDCAQPTSLAGIAALEEVPAADDRDAEAALALAALAPPSDGAGGLPSRARELASPPRLLRGSAAAALAGLIDRVDWSLNGGPFAPVTRTSPGLPAAALTWEIDDVPLVLGANTITVRVRDTSGATATDSVSGLLRDTLDPVIDPASCADETVDLGPGCRLDYGRLPTATDRCDPTLAFTSTPPLPLVFTGPGSQSVAYTVRDDSGNSAACSRTVTAVDLSPPTILCAPDQALECTSRGGLPETDPGVQAWLGLTSASDNCDPNPSLTDDHPAFFPSGCAPGRGTAVTWTARDASGHTGSCVGTLRVEDTTPPEVTATPGPLTLECNALGGVPRGDAQVQSWLAAFAADDRCAASVDLGNDAPALFTSGCAPGLATPVAFSATDDCGNTSTHVESLTVLDATPPALAPPAPITLECSARGGVPATSPSAAAWLGAAQASDVCALPAVVHDAPALFPAACGGLATTVTWTASDGCSATNGTSTLTVVDTAPPLLTVPGPLVLECNSPGGVPRSDPRVEQWLRSAAAEDVCGDALVANDAPALLAAGCAPGQVTVVTFTATDGCGNATVATSTVRVVDTTPPALSVPAPLAVECSAQGGSPLLDPQVQAWLAAAAASDVCGGATVTHDAPALFPSGCVPGTATQVTFTATDDCGNATAASSTLTVVDTTAPVATAPPAATFECSAQGGTPSAHPAVQAWLGQASAADVCGSAALANDAPALLTAGCAPGAPTTVTFTATDGCGNAASAASVARVQDTTPPEVTVPAPVTLECNAPGGRPLADPDVQAWLGQASAVDVCGTATLANDAPGFFPSACAPGATTIVAFSAEDGCANAASRASGLTVVDTTPPALSVPPPLSLECSAAGGVPLSDPRVQAWLAAATGADVCGGAAVANDAPALFPSGCAPGGATTVVTFTAVDDCGNATRLTSSITVVDTTPPVVAGVGFDGACLWPPNHNFWCLDDVAAEVIARDACDPGPFTVTVVGCVSSQPEDATGDGHTAPDCVATNGGRGVCIRSERAGGDPAGRTYTVEVAVADDCGNTSLGQALVHVPHDQSPAADCRRPNRGKSAP